MSDGSSISFENIEAIKRKLPPRLPRAIVVSPTGALQMWRKCRHEYRFERVRKGYWLLHVAPLLAVKMYISATAPSGAVGMYVVD